ncbi:hypothetical protein BASA60_001743 [Batrachochytrium salamandrivorans]|nr:hypothetical protein BASA60_001743 [Batrachochytrium salamandrivorans]
MIVQSQSLALATTHITRYSSPLTPATVSANHSPSQAHDRHRNRKHLLDDDTAAPLCMPVSSALDTTANRKRRLTSLSTDKQCSSGICNSSISVDVNASSTTPHTSISGIAPAELSLSSQRTINCTLPMMLQKTAGISPSSPDKKTDRGVASDDADPSMVQTNRGLAMLESLVDTAIRMISALNTSDIDTQHTAPIRTFVIEVLNRCPASFSSMAVALLYIHRLMKTLNLPCTVRGWCSETCSASSRPVVIGKVVISAVKCAPLTPVSATPNLVPTSFSYPPISNASVKDSHSSNENRSIENTTLSFSRCGRRIFSAALLLAHKHHSEPTFGTRVWARRLGLDTCDVHTSETALLNAIQHNTFVHVDEYHHWIKAITNRIDTHPFSVDHCILCNQQLLSTSIAHLVVECKQVTGHRIQSGLVPAIQKSRLRLLGCALDPGVENVYTWLRGGVLNGEADLDQRWLDRTVEHESMGTRHDNRADGSTVS